MNKVFILVLLLGVAGYACSTTKSGAERSDDYSTTIFLVRHAEKADDGTPDPSLTTQGKQRAQLLAEILSNKNISMIYSSDYKRTKQTAIPLSRNTKIAIRSYDPGNLVSIADQISEIKGQNVLVVGHSNSTPSLANLILEKEEYAQFDESDYGNLIMITIKNGTSTSSLLDFTLK